jgi:hypothetical protein
MRLGATDMSISARIATLIIALGLLSLTGLACGAKTEEVRQLAAEQLEVAAKKLATDSTPSPQAVEKPQDDSITISNPNDSPGSPQLEPNQTSPGSTDKGGDGSITISDPKDPLGSPQLEPNQASPGYTDKGDATQSTTSTGTKTATAKGDTAPAKTSTDGKQQASDTTLTNPKDPGSPGWPSLEENPQLSVGITYVPIWASVGIELRDGAHRDQTIQAVRMAVRSFLWPLAPGGPSAEGWPRGKSVRSREVEVVVARVSRVDEVFGVLVGCESGGAPDPVLMQPQELPALASLSVQIGEPQTREAMLTGPIKSVPVKATAQAPAQRLPKPTATPTPGYC